MKTSPLLLPLCLFSLFTWAEVDSALSDTTLVYGEIGPDPENPDKERALSAQRLYLKDGNLAMETYGEARVVIFDREEDTVRIVDHDKKIYMDLDDSMVAQISEWLTDTQRKVLLKFENKVADLKKKDRERLREILNDLHAATEHQLAEEPELVYEKVEESENVGEFEVEVFDAYRDERHLARYFLAAREAVGLNADDYEALVRFQGHIERFSEQTPGKLKKNFGDFGMLAKDGKIPIEVQRVLPGQEKPSTHRLLNHFDREIEPEWFEIPENYQAVTLRPSPVRAGAANSPEAK